MKPSILLDLVGIDNLSKQLKMKKVIAVLGICMLVLSSCKKDDDYVPNNDAAPDGQTTAVVS